MAPEFRVRHPGGGLPATVRQSAIQAARRSPRAGLVLLARVHDALVRLPDSALGQYYHLVPGECLAFPSRPQDAA
jgi:hypothetical protein